MKQKKKGLKVLYVVYKWEKQGDWHIKKNICIDSNLNFIRWLEYNESESVSIAFMIKRLKFLSRDYIEIQYVKQFHVMK